MSNRDTHTLWNTNAKRSNGVIHYAVYSVDGDTVTVGLDDTMCTREEDMSVEAARDDYRHRLNTGWVVSPW